ncbi:MAG: electron transport complex subunit RsxG [SAR86 cluster bacterium]|uniref:Ion-translocating oxidoreductase complex subunit G n=1 Tax=SAR86 cluster bacterium TaxID=2030880 RepID=A0A2A5CAE6_9GAMM|nr:electron transport complex subunit RsxG [Gammaproteobacteria bacterium AH-315-E17]PCJ40864.1 MAG: electron transport complex subunit RsxG [SAR86 cluster bacterium]
MPNDLQRSIMQNAFKLASFAAVVAIILALVYAISETRITQQQLNAQRQALNIIFPETQHDNDLIDDSFILNLLTSEFNNLDLLGLRESSSAYIARNNMQIRGIILPAIARDGYSGDINILLGISTDGSVTGVRVIAHRETPGLGDKIDLRFSNWILSFNNRSLGNPEPAAWTVKKDGGEFDQFTGATITPRAVTVATAKALQFFEENKSLLLAL